MFYCIHYGMAFSFGLKLHKLAFIHLPLSAVNCHHHSNGLNAKTQVMAPISSNSGSVLAQENMKLCIEAVQTHSQMMCSLI